MKKSLNLIIVCLLLSSCTTMAQNIHLLEPAKHHYATLQKLSDRPNPLKPEMDSIIYPPSEYRSGTLIYSMIKSTYLTETQVEQLKNSLQYPANSSDQTQAELEFLLEWEQKRTAAQAERASKVLAPIGYWPHVNLLKNHSRYQDNLDNLFYEGRAVMGSQTTATNYPATAKLLKGVTSDMRLMEFAVKYHLLRPRPYHLEPKLNPLARISSPSFASGHTLWAYIHAFTWSELIPTKRQAFLALAYEVGESREIMGIHYPSDEEAARILAHKMLVAMSLNPKFKEDLKQAKLEWK